MGYEEFLGVNPWTALFVLLNTLIIFFVARKFLFKPVQKIIHDRQAEIDDMYSKADQARENAEAMEAAANTFGLSEKAAADLMKKAAAIDKLFED